MGLQAWAGVDIGKQHHHAVVVDESGRKLLSRRVRNDERELLVLIEDVAELADEVVWAVDIAGSESALLVALLLAHDQQAVYLSGATVNLAATTYRGAGKTDARDAFVIADQARMRRDLSVLRADEELIVELRMLVARREDLVGNRTRAVNRLRDRLVAISPALERVLDLGCKGPLVLLTGFQTPGGLREAGVGEVTEWLRRRGVYKAATLAHRVVEAARTQQTRLPAERLAALLIAQTAEELLFLGEQIKDIDDLIVERFRRHPAAEVIASLPGIGVQLGAEFLAITGGDLAQFRSPDRLAAMAGVAPVPRDSGKVHGNLRRPRRYHRGLLRVFYLSAECSVRYNEDSKRFVDRKRMEGKTYRQAVIALARRRVNVLWALMREQRCYEPRPAPT
ncbi:IS110 family transposase [Nocardia amamiensis]|uniref:IS110 family transposase n=1 Tax=Nocardia amamiensis TaxID=404578 RepID=UPI0008296B32|nr:IS110 family transposase [Nocardia amamiensis]